MCLKLAPIFYSAFRIIDMYGERLRELRESKKLTQKQLAEKLGLIQQDISRYETEQIDLSTEMIRKFCEFFEVSSDYLLGFTDY